MTLAFSTLKEERPNQVKETCEIQLRMDRRTKKWSDYFISPQVGMKPFERGLN